jgi:DNA-binding Lrp family transcriptional regulator
MDSKDFQLLVALDINARQSYQSLGTRVSLSAHSVSDRLNRLKSKGILQGFMLSIDSSVFGRDDVLLFYRGEFSRKILPEALAAADVSWVAWKVDGAITLRLWTKSELEDINNLVKVLAVRPSTKARDIPANTATALSVIFDYHILKLFTYPFTFS